MDIRIINTYIQKASTEEISNVLHIAFSGDAKQAKSLILEKLLEEPK